MMGVAQSNDVGSPHAAHSDKNVTHNMIWILLIRMVISMVALLSLFNRFLFFNPIVVKAKSMPSHFRHG